MIPSNYDIEIYNGATYTLQLTVLSGVSPLSMSAYDSIKLQIFKPYSISAALEIDAVISGAGNNVLTFTVTAAQSAALMAIKHRYQLKLVEGSEVFIWLKGDCTILNVYKEGSTSTDSTITVTTEEGVLTIEVDGAVDIAVSAKIAAQAAQAAAETAQDLAETAQGLAEDARDAAALSETAAGESETAASGSASAASGSAISALAAQVAAETARDTAQGYANDAANSATGELDFAHDEANFQQLGLPIVVPIIAQANVPTPPAGLVYLFANSNNSNVVSTKNSAGTVTAI
jgi:hypothetical protein